MAKLNIDIINDTLNNKIHISVDNGEFSVIETSREVRTLLRIILNPEKYNVTISEF